MEALPTSGQILGIMNRRKLSSNARLLFMIQTASKGLPRSDRSALKEMWLDGDENLMPSACVIEERGGLDDCRKCAASSNAHRCSCTRNIVHAISWSLSPTKCVVFSPDIRVSHYRFLAGIRASPSPRSLRPCNLLLVTYPACHSRSSLFS